MYCNFFVENGFFVTNLFYKTINSLANWDWERHSDTVSACCLDAKFLDPSCHSSCTALTSGGCQISLQGVWPDQTAAGKSGTETKLNFFFSTDHSTHREAAFLCNSILNSINPEFVGEKEKYSYYSHVVTGENIPLSIALSGLVRTSTQYPHF